MSFLERFSRGLTATFVSRATKMVANGLLLVVLTRYLLSPSEYGLLYLTISIVGVARLFSDLGLSRATAKYLNEFKEADETQVPHVLRIGFTYRILLVVTVATALVIGNDLITSYYGDSELTPFLIVGAVYMVFISLKSFVSVLFQGFSRVTLSAVVNITDSAGRLVFALAFVLLGFGAIGALIGYTIAAALGTAVGVALLYKQYYSAYETADERESDLRERLLKYSVPLTATKSANVLDKRIDTVLVGFLAGPAAAGFYTVGKQVSAFLDVPARSVGFTVSPAYGEDKAKGKLERAARMYEESLRYVLLLYVPAVVGLILVADPAIALIMGEDYAAAAPVVQLMGIFVAFQAVNLVTTQGLDYLGRARDRAIAKGTTAVGNLALNLVLIPPYGATGAAAATALTFGFYTLANVYVMYTELPIRTGRIVRTGGQVLAISACMGVGVALAMPYVDTIESLIAVITFGALVWGALAVATGLLNPREAMSYIG